MNKYTIIYFVLYGILGLVVYLVHTKIYFSIILMIIPIIMSYVRLLDELTKIKKSVQQVRNAVDDLKKSI